MSDTRRVSSGRAVTRRPTSQRRVRRETVPFYHHPALPSLLALIACFAFVAAAIAGVFKVHQVRFVGANLPAAQIEAAANLDGRNIFRVRSDVVISQLQSVRQIAVTQVETEFPDTVVIHARLRQRFAAWQRGSQLLIVDPDGRVVDTVAHTTLPVIVGPPRGRTLGPGVVQAVRYAQTALSGAPHGRIARFEFGPLHGLTIVGVSGWRAIVGRGTPARLDMRIATLGAWLRRFPNNSTTGILIDLRHREPYSTSNPTP
jgi:POTRA domain-containing FtsQ-type protein/cell division protein FtsQ